MHVLVAGCGWLGTAVARALVARGDRVTGIRRDPGRAAALEALGVTPLIVDLAEPGTAARIPADVEAVVACQSAGGESIEEYRRAYLDANLTLFDAMLDRPVRAFVYTGSTGVFAQDDGGEVDEATPVAPASPTGEVLAAAEALVLDPAHGDRRASVVRLSGLYGPARTGMVDRVRSGALSLGPGDDAWMNFCHLDDAVGIVLAALDARRGGAVYHGSDAAPTRRRDVVTWIAQRLGIEPLRRAEVVGRRWAPNRRISSVRTRAELGYPLRFRSFRDGLAPLLGGPTP